MPKIVDRDAMQNSILDAARRVFVARGYHATTIAHVAEAAGLGKGTLYLYFKGKEALVDAVAQRHFDVIEERLAIEPRPADLRAFVGALERAMAVSDDEAQFLQVFFEVFGPSLRSGGMADELDLRFDRLGQRCAHALAHLQAIGEVRADLDANATGRALAAMVDGLVLHRGLLALPKARYARMRRAALALFLDGIAARA